MPIITARNRSAAEHMTQCQNLAGPKQSRVCFGGRHRNLLTSLFASDVNDPRADCFNSLRRPIAKNEEGTMCNLTTNKTPGSRAGRYVRRALSLGLLALLAQMSLPVAARQVPTPIILGETVTGALAPTDNALTDGRPFDTYSFSTETANQSYVITARSPAVPVSSRLFFVDLARTENPFVFLQQAFVITPRGQVQYSGTLAQPGDYEIDVFSSDPEQPTATSYTLSLAEAAAGPSPTGCTGGGLDAPVQIALNQQLNCELTTSDDAFGITDNQSNTYYSKAFSFQSPGGPVTITAGSSAFTAEVAPVDPATGDLILTEMGSITVQAPAGELIFAVDALEPGATGPFTVLVQQGGGGAPPAAKSGGTSKFSTPR